MIFKGVADSAKYVGQSVGIISAALSIFLSGVLNLVWSAVNTIQVIVVLPLMMVECPANALMIFSAIYQLANF